MKIDINKILKKLKSWLATARQYLGFGTLLIFLLAYIFLAFQIHQGINKTPSDDAVQQKLQHISLPHIDQTSVDKINQLRNQNLSVKALFDKARKNPFSE